MVRFPRKNRTRHLIAAWYFARLENTRVAPAISTFYARLGSLNRKRERSELCEARRMYFFVCKLVVIL